MKAISYEEFIKRANVIHNAFFKYNKRGYLNLSSYILITCPIHGDFQQKASIHIKGHGCPQCAKYKSSDNQPHKLTTKEFIKRANKVHNNKYDYSKVVYKNAREKIKIICPEHGEFTQKPDNHCRGQGCPTCGHEKQGISKKKSLDEYIIGFNKRHKNKYIYPKKENISCKNSYDKIKIICPIHGMFKQSIDNHNQGHGCPLCADYGFNPDKPAILYYLYDPQEDLYKIGITNRSVEERFGKSFCSNRAIAILEQIEYSNGMDAYLAEQEILEAFGYARCENPSWPEEKGGKTEFFKWNILN